MDVGASQMPAEPPPPSQINYAPSVPRARRLVRRYWLRTALLVLLASAYWWAPPAWRRVQLVYWYDRCLAHQPPLGTVVQNDGPPSANNTAYVPDAWRRFYTLLSPPGFQSNGTVFLGGRRTPTGRKVLVAVDLAEAFRASAANTGDTQVFHVRAFEHGGLPSGPKQFLDAQPSVSLLPVVRFLAGQPDPADPTHFTIMLDVTGGTAVIDGWVREDRVVLELRPAPVNQPLPASPG
jgi:hypothetical protein